MIDKTLHYIWVGPKPVPDRARNLIESWRKFNPTYKIEFWNESRIDLAHPYIATAYAAKQWANVSNLARLLVIRDHGGIYLDTDVECMQPLDCLLVNTCFFGFQTKEQHRDWVNNAVFGAEPGHWFVKKVLGAVVNRYIGTESARLASPTIVTELLREEGLSSYTDEPQSVKDIMLYPVRTFYPYRWDEKFTTKCIRPDTMLVHHWDMAWFPWWKRTMIKLQRKEAKGPS